MRPTIALACLLASITLGALTQCTTFAQSPSSCQLRVLTEDESGVLVSVDGVAVKERSTGKTIQPASLLAPGVIAFDGIRSGYYVITAAKTGFKRTAHTSHLQCDRSFVGVTVVLYPGKPNEIVESGTPLPDLPLSEDQSTPTQKRTAPESSDYVQNRSPGPLRSAEDDPGVDVGVVIATKANLREGPSTTSAVIRELQRGNILALINRVSVGPWYNVIHIQSSTEGWINGNTIKVKYTEKRKAGPVFQERETGTSQNPSIKITNDSNVMLYLRVGDDDRTVISPHATKAMSKLPGTYKFYASSPGVIPLLGEHEFRAGIIYEWTFYIVTISR